MKDNNFFELKNNFDKYKNVKSKLVIGDKQNIYPEFSILIPTYDRLKYLDEAIESAINQNFIKSKFEIIIVDNDPKSNLEVESMIQSKKCKNLVYYKNESNIGMVGNWNRCIELSSGKWITFLHDDDLLEDHYLQKMNSFINKHPDYYLIAPTAQILKNEYVNKPIKARSKGKYIILKIQDLIYGNPVPTQGTMFDKKIAVELGGFSEKWWPGMDWIFWINYITKYNGVLIKDKLLFYRKHNEAESFKIETKREIVELKLKIQSTLEGYRTPLQYIYSYFLKKSDYTFKYKSYKIFYKLFMYLYHLVVSVKLFLRQKNQ